MEMLFSFSKIIFLIIFPMTFRTQVYPIVQIPKIFSSFISKVNTFWSGFDLSAKLARVTAIFFTSYPSMQGSISYGVAFPVNIFVAKYPYVDFSSNPRCVTNPTRVANKTLRHFLSACFGKPEVFLAPFKVAGMGTILSKWNLVVVNFEVFVASMAFNLIHGIDYTTLTVQSERGIGS